MALKTKSVMYRGKVEKTKALVARLALMIAAKENPSMYDKYLNMRKKYLQVKLMVIKRYTPKAIAAARKLLAAPSASGNVPKK